jgi:hypothetical protein
MEYIEPHGMFGRFVEYSAKIGSHSSTVVAVKRTRKFYVGQQILFAELNSRSSKSIAPKWESGMIHKLDDNRLFISRR